MTNIYRNTLLENIELEKKADFYYRTVPAIMQITKSSVNQISWNKLKDKLVETFPILFLCFRLKSLKVAAGSERGAITFYSLKEIDP